MTKQFAHLHLHTQYSLLDGANKISELFKRAKVLGQPGVAITDHGNMHGAIEFYNEAKKNEIKPIIGCELYVAKESRFDRTKERDENSIYHLTVLAKNNEGYKNLCHLTSLAYKEGFYYKPRVDHEILERYSQGLVVLSGCLGGELADLTEAEDRKRSKELMEFYLKCFKDDFYLEVQPHNIKRQKDHNNICIDLAKEFGVPLVASTDCHYLNQDDHYAQEVLMCVSTGKNINDPSRIQHVGYKLHLKSREEMEEELKEESWAEEALNNTLSIVEKCNLSFDFSTYYMPVYPLDKDSNGKEVTAIEVMSKNSREGLKKRISVIKARDPEFDNARQLHYEDRLELEIRLIDKMGFAGYFLVVADFIVWAKENGIAVGPGRGSCAGSLVAYALRITDVDPIENKLLFERFLNPDRVSLPDIDVDFCIYGRDKVIKYVTEKYGKDRVAQIATFGTMKAKAAIKDVGRTLGMTFAETDKIAELIPAPRQGFDYSITDSIGMEPRLAEYAKGEGKKLIDLALRLEGLTRHASTHAAGVVIADRPLMELLPMMKDKAGNDVTQYSMSYVEKIGLVKFDFLGLKTLTVINSALNIIKESCGVTIDLETLPLNDPKTLSMLCGGNTTGVFQLESSGITEMTIRLKPNSFDDIVAILALYRPGPLDAGMVDHYINRKHGREPVTYLHPKMKGVLSDTYGIMLYQEQIMQLARELAGYSLAEADLLRKAMGKKNPEEMKKQKERFMTGCSQNQIEKKLAEEIFSQMETFARYGFNRSHSVAYAMISYQTAYLKAHYPVEFMAGLMTHEIDDTDKILKNLTECRKQKIEVTPPHINQSNIKFTVNSGKIVYGLEAIKGVGEKVAEAIVNERNKNGDYKDFEDLVSRMEAGVVNRKAYDSFIKCGAFDFTGLSRRELFERIEPVIKLSQSMQKEKNSAQFSLFSMEEVQPALKRPTTNLPEWPVNQKLDFERYALGFYITGHPLEKFSAEMKKRGVVLVSKIKEKGNAESALVAGIVTALKLKNTKKGDRYASFGIEDFTGVVEALAWPEVYKRTADLLASNEPILAKGKVDIREDRATFIVDTMESLIQARNKSATYGLINFKPNDTTPEKVQSLLKILERHGGSCSLKAKVYVGDETVDMVLRDSNNIPVKVEPSEALCDEVEELFGGARLFFY